MEFSLTEIDPISYRQAAMLRASCRYLRRKSFGTNYARLLFTRHPEFGQWYSRDISETMARYCGLLDAVVANLEEVVGNNFGLTDGMAISLQNLGATHAEFGVAPDHYRMVFDTFIEAMRQERGGIWSGEMEASWRHLFQHIIYCMDIVTKQER